MLIELLTKHYPGMRQWLAQRFSAIYLAVYTILFLLIVAVQQPEGYVGWQALFTPSWWRVLTMIFFISLFMHAWLGVRDVLKDYVFNATLRAYMQLLVDIALIGYLVWSAMVLWRL